MTTQTKGEECGMSGLGFRFCNGLMGFHVSVWEGKGKGSSGWRTFGRFSKYGDPNIDSQI